MSTVCSLMSSLMIFWMRLKDILPSSSSEEWPDKADEDLSPLDDQLLLPDLT